MPGDQEYVTGGKLSTTRVQIMKALCSMEKEILKRREALRKENKVYSSSDSARLHLYAWP